MLNETPQYIGVFYPHEFQNLNRVKSWRLLRVGLSEMAGTGLFVCLGCMSNLPGVNGDFLDVFSGVLSFTFAIATSIMIFGHISCLINPALAAVDVLRGEKSIFMFIYLVLMQCWGSFLGYALLRTLVPDEVLGAHYVKSFCCMEKDERVSSMQAVGVEMLITGILSLFYCSMQDPKNPDRNQTVALKYGFAILALLLPSVHYIGSCMNPARSFGPALYNNNWQHQWIYWIGPMMGAIVAAAVYGIIFA